MTSDPEAVAPSREQAHAYALKLLAMRGYSMRDLGRKLARRGYPQAEVDATLERLGGSGLLDDQRFSEQYARSRIVNDSASPRRVVQLLTRYGITRQMAEAAVARVIEDEELDTAATVELLARRKAASLTGLEPAVVRRRLYGFLARRGFNLDDIRGAVSAVLERR